MEPEGAWTAYAWVIALATLGMIVVSTYLAWRAIRDNRTSDTSVPPDEQDRAGGPGASPYGTPGAKDASTDEGEEWSAPDTGWTPDEDSGWDPDDDRDSGSPIRS